MSETVNDATAETPAAEETATAEQTETPAEKVAGEEALGDPGKKALDAMKAERNAEKARARELEARVAELTAKVEGKEAEFTAAQEAQRVKDEAIAAANERILRAEIKAAAKGTLADPADAFRFLDVSSFEVGDDGDVDAEAINAAINDLITSKPYLAAQGGKRFQGTADGGARNDANKVSQLSRADMASMSPEQIDAAFAEGRFKDLLGGK